MPPVSFMLTVFGGSLWCQTFLSLHNARYGRCPNTDTESCVMADVDLHMIKNDDSIELPDGTQLQLTSRDENAAVFQTGGGEAIFVWDGDVVAGSVHLNGLYWQLQGCGKKCHLWMKYSSDPENEATYVDTSTPRPS